MSILACWGVLTCSTPIVTLNGSGGGSYAWSGPSGYSSVLVQPNVVNAGTYTLIVTVTGCASAPSTVTVTSNTVAPAVPTISQLGNVLTSSSPSNNQWFLNGSIMPGETNQNLTVTQNGNYTVQVTDPTNSCISNSTVFVFGSIGIENTSSPSMSLNIFPNPNKGQFEVTLYIPNKTNVKLEISNVLGQIIYREEMNNLIGQISKLINLNSSGSGQYFITLTNSNGRIIKKIIVQ